MASRTAELIAKLTDQVSGPAKGMAGVLKGTVSALDALKAKAGKLDAFKQASKALDDASQKFKLAQQNLRKVKAEMDAAGDGGKKLGAAFRSAQREVDAAKAAFKSQGQEVRAMRTALSEAGVPLNRLAAYERQLRGEIDRTTASLQRQKKAAHEALGGAGGRGPGSLGGPGGGGRAGGGPGGAGHGAIVGAGLARFGAAAAGIGGGAYIVGDQIRRAAASSISFERSLIEVGKATDTSGADLEVYSEKLLRLARQTGKSKEELASMLSQAGFAGRPKEELMDFTEYSAKAMVAWQTGAEDTGQALAEIGNIYGANQKRIEEIGDAINTMADNSASRESDLLEFMRRAGASSKEAGMSAEKMLAFGAAMKEVGVRNEVAATGFEALLNVMKLGEEFSKKAGEGLKGLGINSTKMRRQFVAKPVETILMLLNKIKDVADPLKRAEIMTNLFGKAYQDDIAKMLNALPQLSKYLELMGDKAKIAAGGVRFQFGQNIDKDVSKIDRATQSIDVLYKRLGDPIKVQAGSIAEQINAFVDRLEQGDTIAQRLMKRLTGNEKGDNVVMPENPLQDWFEKNVPYLSGKEWNDWIDSKIGKTGADTERMNREDVEARRAAERQSILDKPGDIETKIQRQREAQVQSRKEAATSSGLRRSTAMEQVGRSDAEIKRLEGELARAWEAIGELRSREKREKGAFGVEGPTGKDVESLGPGRFGFGLHGTDNFTLRTVPLPPKRPEGLGEEIKPKVDAAEIEAAGTKLDAAKGKMTELGGISVTPKVDPSSISAAEAAVDRLIGKLSQAGSVARSVGSQAAAAIANVGAGARTGAVKTAMSGAFSDQGMG